MNALVDDLLNYPAQVEGVESYLKKLRAKTDVILSEANNATHNGGSTALLDVLRNVAPASCTAGCALLLSFQADALNANLFPAYVLACKGFLMCAQKDHLQLANKEVSKMLQKLVALAINVRKPRSVVNILQLAVKLTAPNANCLTAAHSLLLQACIKGQVYDVAVELLRNTDILEIDMKNAAISGSEFLQFFYYAGICYIAVEDYPAALASFFQCMSAPATALSQIVICAVKKARLVALIHYGRELYISAPMSGVVSRFVKSAMAVYDPICKAFALDDLQGLRLAVETGSEQLIKDGNLGLAQRAVTSLTSHRLRRLSSTFLSLSLADIATRVELPSPAQAEQELLSLIRKRQLFATLDPATGYVHFHDSAGHCATSSTNVNNSSSSGGGQSGNVEGKYALGSAEAAAQVQVYLTQTMQLSMRLQEMQRAAQLSNKYLVKQTASRHLGTGLGPGMGIMGMGSGMGMGGDDYMDLS